MEDHTKHYLISGRVQGVGFRRFVHLHARDMKLRGWVRNLHDGRVEALASGPGAALERFENAIKGGPPHSRVETLEVRVTEHRIAAGSGFVVQEDGDRPWFDKV